MPHSLAHAITPRTLLAGIFVCAGVVAWPTSVHGEDQADATLEEEVAATKLGVPARHVDIYARLNRRVPLNFEKASLDDVLPYLEKHLGRKIELDKSAFTKANLDHTEITLIAQEPVTIKRALRGLTQQFPLSSYRIGFTESGVKLLPPDQAAKQYVLQTHDLRFIPDYNTKFRQRLIEQARREIAAEEWAQEDGPWIVPGTSVFTVDVYHRPNVQNKVAESWFEDFHVERRRVAIANVESLDLTFNKNPWTEEKLAARAKELRAEYPFESLAGRLKYEESKASESPGLSDAAEQRLHERDERDALARKSNFAWLNLRRASLEKLHSDEVQKFVAREGFGVSRMPSPGPSFLPLPPPPQFVLPSAEIDPAQDEPLVRVPANAAEAAAATIDVPTGDDLTALHVASETAFVPPQRLGYVKDREHVAGFGSHAFERLPRLVDDKNWLHEPTEHWAMRRMELVSLLKHDKPQVYISDELPRLDKLDKIATRDLGMFEADALSKLNAGEEVVTRATVNRIEMLGALRASKSCLECHSVEHGQLLGAFSYTLVRDPLLDETAKAAP